jgi:PBSX family phage terminase large subunit
MEVTFKPSPKQYRLWQILHNKEQELILSGGAAGGGKSYTGCVWMVTMCLQYPDIRGVIGRKTLKSLKESTANTLFSILKQWKVPYKFNQLESFLVFENGSKIIFKELATVPSDPNFERFGSSEFTIGFIDEVSEVDEKAVEVLRSRMRWKVAEYGLIPKLLMSTNPTMNWVRSRFVMADDGSDVVTAPDEAYVPFSVFDNPDVDFRKQYVKSLEKIRDTETRNRLLYGNWAYVEAKDDAAYHGFDGNRHLITNLKEQKYDSTKTLHLTFDFNLYPFVSCLAIQMDVDTKTIYVLEEILGLPKDKQNNTKGISAKVLEIYGEHTGGVIIYGDPSNKKGDTRSEEGFNDYTIIGRELEDLDVTFKIPEFHPPVKTRLEFINEVFAKQYCGWKIYIDMRCRKFTEDLIYGPVDENGNKSKKKIMDAKLGQKYEQYHHLSDAFDYFMCMALRAFFAKYKKGGRHDSKPMTTKNTSIKRYRF